MFKIDLYSQTSLSKKNSDKINFIPIDVFNGWVKEKVKIASFTDKNIFNFNFYKKWKDRAHKYNVLLIPGVELIVKNNGKEQDIILNFSENLDIKKLKQIDSILNSRSARFFKSFDEIVKIFDEFKPLYIPHIGKSHHNCKYDLLKNNLNKIFVIESTNINGQDHKSFIKKTNYKYKNKIVHFSDTYRWAQYPEYGLKNVFEKPINNFEELYDFFKNNDIILKL